MRLRKQARLQEAKERRLAAMRHAALDERGEDGGIEERAILESDPDMDTGTHSRLHARTHTRTHARTLTSLHAHR